MTFTLVPFSAAEIVDRYATSIFSNFITAIIKHVKTHPLAEYCIFYSKEKEFFSFLQRSDGVDTVLCEIPFKKVETYRMSINNAIGILKNLSEEFSVSIIDYDSL